jgi:hypothetical protein
MSCWGAQPQVAELAALLRCAALRLRTSKGQAGSSASLRGASPPHPRLGKPSQPVPCAALVP